MKMSRQVCEKSQGGQTEFPVGAEYAYKEEWMEANRKGPRKQRRTAMLVYHQLQEELGYGGSYSNVRRYM